MSQEPTQYTDKQVRRYVQNLGWYFAASRDDGPAHIVYDYNYTLCGSTFDNRAHRQATNACKKCMKIARTKI